MQVKTKCLEIALLGSEKDGSWDEVVIEFKTSIEDKQTETVAEVWKYRGELEQLHGEREAKRFIKRGKYEIGTDEDGTVCYKKKEYKADSSRTVSKKGAVKKTKDGEEDGGGDKLAALMNSTFASGTGFALFHAHGPKAMKRPVAAIGDKPKQLKNQETRMMMMMTKMTMSMPKTRSRKRRNRRIRSSWKLRYWPRQYASQKLVSAR